MKKNLSFILLSFLFLGLFFGCSKSESKIARKNQLIVYTYNSFSDEWGAGPEIARLFKEKTGISVIYADCGDSAQILSKVILERENPYADVLIGLDNNFWQKAEEANVLQPYKPTSADSLIPGLEEQLGGKWVLTPYDFSKFAFIFDSSLSDNLPAPASLEDLTKPIYKNKIILMDSRTSTMGMGFEQWVSSVYKDERSYDDFMNRLKPSVLTVAPGWSIGYGMFTSGEAPLVFSYITSPAYHIYSGEGERFKALKFSDGHVMQVEGAGIIKGAQNIEGAKKFIDFLISDEAQKLIPLTQWMFPSNANVKLPECYDNLMLGN